VDAKTTLALSLVLAAGLSADVNGQEIIRGYLGGGVTAPVGPLAASSNPGYNILIGVSVRPALIHLGLRADAMFSEFTASGRDSGYSQFISFNLNPIFTFANGPIAPYIFGGPGYYFFRGTQAQALNVTLPTTQGTPYTSSHFGVDAGAGVRGRLTYFSLFLEARDQYVFVGRTQRSYVPVTAGISLPYPWGEFAPEGGIPGPPGPP
jgi:hypothetical protein